MCLKKDKRFIRRHKRHSCKWKRSYSLLGVLIRFLTLKIKNKNIRMYKCLYGNHYHVGNIRKYTLRTRRKAKRLMERLNEKS